MRARALQVLAILSLWPPGRLVPMHALSEALAGVPPWRLRWALLALERAGQVALRPAEGEVREPESALRVRGRAPLYYVVDLSGRTAQLCLRPRSPAPRTRPRRMPMLFMAILLFLGLVLDQPAKAADDCPRDAPRSIGHPPAQPGERSAVAALWALALVLLIRGRCG